MKGAAKKGSPTHPRSTYRHGLGEGLYGEPAREEDPLEVGLPGIVEVANGAVDLVVEEGAGVEVHVVPA